MRDLARVSILRIILQQLKTILHKLKSNNPTAVSPLPLLDLLTLYGYIRYTYTTVYNPLNENWHLSCVGGHFTGVVICLGCRLFRVYVKLLGITAKLTYWFILSPQNRLTVMLHYHASQIRVHGFIFCPTIHLSFRQSSLHPLWGGVFKLNIRRLETIKFNAITKDTDISYHQKHRSLRIIVKQIISFIKYKNLREEEW